MKRSIVVAVLSAILLAGCGTISAAQSVRNWTKQANFASNTRTLVDDAKTSVGQLRIATTSAPVLHTVCGVLLTDTEAANASLPSPDTQANNWLAPAYVNLGAGANTCYNAAGNPRLRAKAIAYLRHGVAQLSFGALRLTSATAGP